MRAGELPRVPRWKDSADAFAIRDIAPDYGYFNTATMIIGTEPHGLTLPAPSKYLQGSWRGASTTRPEATGRNPVRWWKSPIDRRGSGVVRMLVMRMWT